MKLTLPEAVIGGGMALSIFGSKKPAAPKVEEPVFFCSDPAIRAKVEADMRPLVCTGHVIIWLFCYGIPILWVIGLIYDCLH